MPDPLSSAGSAGTLGGSSGQFAGGGAAGRAGAATSGGASTEGGNSTGGRGGGAAGDAGTAGAAEDVEAGAGGSLDAGAGGETDGGAGSSGSGGVSGGAAGSGGTLTGGRAGGGSGGVACDEPRVWYPDADQDGFGRSSESVIACEPPSVGSWVTQGGDCNDDNAAVSPDPNRKYSGVFYVAADGSHSFDYDCSGIEESDPSQYGAAPTCNGLSLLDCAGKQGFVPVTRSGSGNGSRINALCGSTQLRVCVSNGLTCVAMTQIVEPHRCR